MAMDNDQQQQYLELVQDISSERHQGMEGVDIPHILLPYQQAWQADTSPVRLGEKSRRIGWSWGMAAEAVLEAAEEGGMDQFYVGYNLPMAAEFIGDCAFFARAFSIVAGEIDVTLEHAVLENERRDIVKYSIQLSSGNKIEALSSNPHNFRGRQGHARIDEAAFHQDLAELLKAALAFLIWGGRVSVVSTHNGDDNPFNLMIRDIQAGKLNYSHHKVTFDDALQEGFYKRICLVQGKDWTLEGEAAFREHIVSQYGDGADEELFCIPRKGSGIYFPRTLLERCAQEGIPVVRYSKPEEWVLDDHRDAEADKWIRDVLKPVIDNLPTDRRSVFGQDFGRSGDLSVNWILQEAGPGQWDTAFVLELRNIPFDIQQKIMFFILDELPLFHHAKFDARGNGQSHAEAALQKYGPARIECVMATPAWYATAFPKYRTAFEDKSISIPMSEDIIADHRRVILEKGRPKMDDGRDKGSDGLYRHGDSAIAGLLAWMATQEEGQPPAGATVDDVDVLDTFEAMSARGRRRASLFGRGRRALQIVQAFCRKWLAAREPLSGEIAASAPDPYAKIEIGGL
ncbi:MAG: terminase family protein [Pseudomonadota bacterium]|nr:terminase family protein [Pseudomonadota bacterium]